VLSLRRFPGICPEDLRKTVETFKITGIRDEILTPRLPEYDFRVLGIFRITLILLACYITMLSVAEIM
jgi:hypothetical protein